MGGAGAEMAMIDPRPERTSTVTDTEYTRLARSMKMTDAQIMTNMRNAGFDETRIRTAMGVFRAPKLWPRYAVFAGGAYLLYKMSKKR